MRPLLAALTFCFLFAATPAHAFLMYGEPAAGAHQSVTHIEKGHTAAASRLSPSCRQAAALGGPCGCWASEHFFGRSIRALWPVSAWLALFERTSPRPGVAAIWPGRHVAPVVAASGDGTVTVADSWGTHRVSTRGLIFVDPYGARRFSSL